MTKIVYSPCPIQTDERAPSPEAVLLRSSQESFGPSEDDEAEFAKELAKMVTDTAESRKVDKKTALALWDQTIPPPVVRKKRGDDSEDAVDSTNAAQDDQAGVMKFTLFTKRGNKPQVGVDRNKYSALSVSVLTLVVDEAVGYSSRIRASDSNTNCSAAR